ncbi:MAG: hypothetical protein QOK38_2099 [Acidobacteriaceae bacterium]|jgi:hypothetical protein|nr:hypothetical protein [Acidobacteriaceae bacterium]
MRTKRPLGVLSVVPLLSLVGGCPTQLVKVSEMAGKYEYHSGNVARGSICFELHTNGTYVLGDAKEPLKDLSMSGSQEEGRWNLGSTTGQVLVIGNSSLPIEHTPSSIRVTVNDDLGMYCDLSTQS